MQADPQSTFRAASGSPQTGLSHACDNKSAQQPTYSSRRVINGVPSLVGLALIVAPFIFGINTVSIALWTNMLLGAFVAPLAGYQTFGNPSPR